MANVQALQIKGWYLTPEGIQECTEEGKETVQDIIRVALDLDLKDIGERHLPDGINKGKQESVAGPFVVQIQKVRNVTAPKENEESQAAPQLMKLTLTDGHSTCVALGMEKIPQLSLNTPPGTKVELQGAVPVQHGFLLLNSSNVKILGGRVDKLVQGWELKRTLAKHSRNPIAGEGGPPPFIPFGQRHRQPHDSKPEHRSRDNFKSLETSKEKKEADGNFEQQRQATIAEVLQVKGDGKPKAFGGNLNKVPDRDMAQIMEMGFSAEQAAVALKANYNNIEEALNSLLNVQQEPKGRGYQDRDGRGPRNGENRRSDSRDQDREGRGNHDGGDSGRGDYGGRSEYSSRGDYGGRSRGRGAGPPRQSSAEDKPQRGRGRRGREQEEDGYDEHPSKPSAPATLFDFLTSKMPAKDDAQTHSTMQAEEKPSKEPDHWNAQQERRGPPNLPPRLLKQQKLQEEQRGQRYDRDRGQPRSSRGGPDGPGSRGSQNRNFSSDSNYNSRGPSDDRGKSRGNRNMSRNQDSGRQNQNRGYQNSGSSQNSRAESSESGQGGDKRTYSGQKSRQDNNYNQNRRSDRNLNYNQVDNNSLQNRSSRMDNQGRDRENQYHDISSVQAEQNRRQQNVPSSAPRQAVSMQQQQQQYQILTRVPPQQVTEPTQTSQVTYYQPAPDMTQQNHMYQVASQQPTDLSGQTYYQITPQDANQHNHTYQMAPQVSGDQGQYTTTYQMTQNFQSITLAGQQDYTMQNTIQGYGMDPNMMATYETKAQLAQRSQGYPTAATMANTNMSTSMAAMQMDMRPPRQWKPQDYCMAKYWDGKFYRAVVESPSQDNQTIHVNFPDYGNTEQVLLTDVRTIPKQAWDSNRFHQPTASTGPGPAVASCVPPVSIAASMGTNAYVARDQQPYQHSVGSMEFRRGGGGVVYRMPDQARRQPQRLPQQLYVPPGQRTRPM